MTGKRKSELTDEQRQEKRRRRQEKKLENLEAITEGVKAARYFFDPIKGFRYGFKLVYLAKDFSDWRHSNNKKDWKTAFSEWEGTCIPEKHKDTLKEMRSVERQKTFFQRLYFTNRAWQESMGRKRDAALALQRSLDEWKDGMESRLLAIILPHAQQKIGDISIFDRAALKRLAKAAPKPVQ